MSRNMRRRGAKWTPPAYREVRQQHPHIERKLAELVQRHEARRVRYRGRLRARIQYLLTALVVNIKRIVHLMDPVRHPGGVRQMV